MKKKNKQPLVSIIINCFNGEKFLKKSINSAIKQTYKNIEIIFWNNNSTDNSQKIVSNCSDSRIRCFKSKKFLKLYEARNEAIKISKGKYISFLDVDDWWVPKKISDQIKLIEKKNLTLVYSNYYIFDEKKKIKKIYTKRKLPTGYISQKLLDKYDIGILTVLVKKKVFKEKKFNKKYEIIGDFDFFTNLSIKDKFGCIQDPLAYYRLHENNISTTRRNLHIKEMQDWLRSNEIKLKKKNLNLNAQKYYLNKLKIKNLLNKFISVF